MGGKSTALVLILLKIFHSVFTRIQMSNSDESSNPTQNRFLEEQLTHMDQNWDELDQMMKNRELLLRNELAELRFNNDCQLVEQALANQEVKLQSAKGSKVAV